MTCNLLKNDYTSSKVFNSYLEVMDYFIVKEWQGIRIARSATPIEWLYLRKITNHSDLYKWFIITSSGWVYMYIRINPWDSVVFDNSSDISIVDKPSETVLHYDNAIMRRNSVQYVERDIDWMFAIQLEGDLVEVSNNFSRHTVIGADIHVSDSCFEEHLDINVWGNYYIHFSNNSEPHRDNKRLRQSVGWIYLDRVKWLRPENNASFETAFHQTEYSNLGDSHRVYMDVPSLNPLMFAYELVSKAKRMSCNYVNVETKQVVRRWWVFVEAAFSCIDWEYSIFFPYNEEGREMCMKVLRILATHYGKHVNVKRRKVETSKEEETFNRLASFSWS